jgi:hypothetical protein
MHLSGKNMYNKISLTGKNVYRENALPVEIKNMKIKILNDLIMPFISKQWNILKENLFVLEKTKEKLDYYIGIYKLDELIIYKEIIRAIELIVFQNEQLEHLEKNMYNNEDVSTMVYKITTIRMKPEYEMYDIILGRPDKKLNQKYDESIIKEIGRLLLIGNMTFNKIKMTIQNNYIHM